MIRFISASTLLFIAACASGPEPYQRADSSKAFGAYVLPIEDNRVRVSYRAKDAETSRHYALLAAAEETLLRDATWFRVVDAYRDEAEQYARQGGSSISIGGSTGSRGRSSIGIGVGIGFPIGGTTGSGESVHALEIIVGSGAKPDDPEVYDAAEVRDSLLGAPIN